MAINYKGLQASVTDLIARYGLQITLQKPDGTSAKSKAVWGRIQRNDSTTMVSHVATERRTLMVSGSIKKSPEIGDVIVLGGLLWSVMQVDVYEPASIVLAYKVTVTQ